MTTGAAIPRAGSESVSLSPSSGNETPCTSTGPTSPTKASGRSGDTVAFGPSPPPVDGDVVVPGAPVDTLSGFVLGEVATGAPAVVAGAASSSSPHPASARTSMTPARQAGLDLTMAPVRGKGGR